MLVAGFDRSLLNFRGPLLQALHRAGYDVIAAAPSESSDVPAALLDMGIRFQPVSIERAGLNPIADVMSLRRLRALFERERPEVILSYTIKPVIYGSLAAGQAKVPRIYALITGLGAAYHSSGVKGFILKETATQLYRLALKRCTKIFVQNQDIANLFQRRHITSSQKLIVVPGSGIDVGHYAAADFVTGRPVFLVLARMLRDKGIAEYVAAAKIVKLHEPAARFLLVGDTDSNPAAISAEQLAKWNTDGVVEYRPSVSDVRPLLAACSVYVLPSYHEGMPRSVLEAMATGRPVITTDTIGCRETIINAGPADQQGIRVGENGLLVPVARVEPLAAAMLKLLKDCELSARMGRRGRQIAEERFDVHKINFQMMQAMNLAPGTLS